MYAEPTTLGVGFRRVSHVRPWHPGYPYPGTCVGLQTCDGPNKGILQWQNVPFYASFRLESTTTSFLSTPIPHTNLYDVRFRQPLRPWLSSIYLWNVHKVPTQPLSCRLPRPWTFAFAFRLSWRTWGSIEGSSILQRGLCYDWLSHVHCIFFFTFLFLFLFVWLRIHARYAWTIWLIVAAL